jgi:hypothetical protein
MAHKDQIRPVLEPSTGGRSGWFPAATLDESSKGDHSKLKKKECGCLKDRLHNIINYDVRL